MRPPALSRVPATRLMFVAALVMVAAQLPAADRYEGAVKVTVRYVDVLVTDRSGDPITDLERDDFVVLEDGVEQEITDFTRRDADPLPVEDAVLGHPHVVLLFDAKHMSFGQIDRPKRAAMRMLDGLLTPDTQAALLVLRHHLEAVADFSTDHQGLKERVKEILWWAPDRAGAATLAASPSSADAVGGRLSISLYPSYAGAGPDSSLFGVLEGLGRGLARVRGPKTVVLFSEGISGSLDDARVAAAYQRMIGALNGGNVAVMAVDTEGLRGKLGRSDRLFRALPQINLVGTAGKSSLRAVARQTGGDVLIGSNNMAGWIQESLQARSQSYVIGYAPKSEETGGYHELEVKVRRRGARVTARKGFEDLATRIERNDDERRMRLRSEIASWVLWRDVPLRMQNVAFPTSGKDSLVVVAVEVDARSHAPAERVRLDLEGSLVEVKSRNVHDWSGEVDAVKLGSDRMYYLKILRLPWGTYVSKSVSGERGSDRMGASEIRLEVPRQTKVGPMMSQLAILDPTDPSPVVVEAQAPSPADALLVHDGRRLAPSFDRIFEAGQDIVVAHGIWGLSRERRTQSTRGTVVVALVRDGKRVREKRHEWRASDGRGAEKLQPLHTPLSLAGLPAGAYVVEARVIDRLIDAEAVERVAVTIQ